MAIPDYSLLKERHKMQTMKHVLFTATVLAILQVGAAQVRQVSQWPDLRIGPVEMGIYLTQEFQKNQANLLDDTGEGAQGVFWIKLIFDDKGAVVKYDISSGTTPKILQFVAKELPKVTVGNKLLLTNSEELQIIMPIKFSLLRGGYYSPQITIKDSETLLDFFSAPQGTKAKNQIILQSYTLHSGYR